MAIYYCEECDKYINDDYNPGTDVNGELVCEDCACEMEDDDGLEIPLFEGTRELLAKLGT
jgi:hypothetical protein